MTLTLAQIPGWLVALLIALFLITCVVMILTVLIQRPTGGGLVGAFGSGAGSGQTVFGTKTGDALTVATISMFVIYLLFAVGLNYAVRPPKGAPAAPAEAAQTAPAETGTGAATPAATTPTPAATEPAAPAASPVVAPAPSGESVNPAPSGAQPAPAGAQPAPATTPPAGPAPK